MDGEDVDRFLLSHIDTHQNEHTMLLAKLGYQNYNINHWIFLLLALFI